MAEHYNVPHLDLHQLVLKTVLDDQWRSEHLSREEAGKSKWDLLARLYIDHVHPNKPDLGTLLISDLLVAWLYEMQERVAREPTSAPAPKHAMPKAIVDLARFHYRTRCFGVSFEQTLKIIESKASVSEQEREALDKFKTAAGDFFGGTANEGQYNQGMHSLPPLKVTRNEGFIVQTSYRSPSGALKFKPGYLADKAGSVLEFEFDASFEDAWAAPEALITYTRSYDGWGMARVNCLSGCSCDTQFVDAATKEKTSLHHTLVVRLNNATGSCVMRVDIVPMSTSGGHRFKVSAVMARALRKEKDADSALPGRKLLM